MTPGGFSFAIRRGANRVTTAQNCRALLWSGGTLSGCRALVSQADQIGEVMPLPQCFIAEWFCSS